MKIEKAERVSAKTRKKGVKNNARIKEKKKAKEANGIAHS